MLGVEENPFFSLYKTNKKCLFPCVFKFFFSVFFALHTVTKLDLPYRLSCWKSAEINEISFTTAEATPIRYLRAATHWWPIFCFRRTVFPLVRETFIKSHLLLLVKRLQFGIFGLLPISDLFFVSVGRSFGSLVPANLTKGDSPNRLSCWNLGNIH